MIIIYFPKTLGGVSFEKAGKLCGERKPIFFDKTVFLSPHLSLSQKNDQRGFPFGNPKTYVFFLFLLLVVISFGYLAIYMPFTAYKVGRGGAIMAKLEFSLENSRVQGRPRRADYS